MPGILIIDDSATSRAALRLALRPLGLDIAEAPSAERALPMVRLLKPALVVCDLNLPGMSGLQFAARVRDELEENPVVMLVTGEDADEWRQRATEAGASVVVSKPVSPRVLADHARRLLEETP